MTSQFLSHLNIPSSSSARNGFIRIRKSAERGYADHGWLKTKHTFSFASYFSREYQGYRCLRVINEDRVQRKTSFLQFPMNSSFSFSFSFCL
jgi:hypothetical protein